MKEKKVSEKEKKRQKKMNKVRKFSAVLNNEKKLKNKEMAIR